MIEIERESIEQVACDIAADEDPTEWTIEFAFPTAVERPSTWEAGSWAAPAQSNGSGWLRRALTPTLGAGGLDLEAAGYRVYARVNGGAVVFVDVLRVR